MNNILFFICVLLMFNQIELHCTPDTIYYWYKGNKRNLDLSPDTRFFLLPKDYPLEQYCSQNNDIEILKYGTIHTIKSIVSILDSNSINNKQLVWALIRKSFDCSWVSISFNEEKIYESNCVVNKNGKTMGLSHLFNVKLQRQEDLSLLKQFAKENNVEVMGYNSFRPLWFTISCINSNANSIFMANAFNETGLFEFCIPDFITINDSDCVNDTYWIDQWGLENTGQHGENSGIDINFCNAREISMGNENIKVAIIDKGVEKDHTDLPNVEDGYDASFSLSPAVVWNSNPHGTNCAGIIGAAGNNEEGITGIAPNCKIVPVSYLKGPGENQAKADAIEWAWEYGQVDVINCSWHIDAEACPEVEIAIDNALTLGRNGLGCVVVFSSSNDNLNEISFPANYTSNILVVGAMCPDGKRKEKDMCDGSTWGSNYGTELDIIAPGVFIPTTTLTGMGDNNGDYNLSWEGTSAAAPHVSGLAALILSVDPCLTGVEVNTYIEENAQKVGGYIYEDGVTNRHSTWNEEAGYGLIDADATLYEVAKRFLLQNVTIDSETSVAGVTAIRAGFNVNPQKQTGNYEIVPNYGDLKIKSATSITLEPGFIAHAGSNFWAHIEMFNNDCENWPSPNAKTNQAGMANYEGINESPTAIAPFFFPNPHTDELYLKYELQEDENLVLQYYDILGKQLGEEKFSRHSGINIRKLNVDIEKGIVIAKLCIGQQCYFYKLIKQ